MPKHTQAKGPPSFASISQLIWEPQKLKNSPKPTSAQDKQIRTRKRKTVDSGAQSKPQTKAKRRRQSKTLPSKERKVLGFAGLSLHSLESTRNVRAPPQKPACTPPEKKDPADEDCDECDEGESSCTNDSTDCDMDTDTSTSDSDVLSTGSPNDRTDTRDTDDDVIDDDLDASTDCTAECKPTAGASQPLPAFETASKETKSSTEMRTTPTPPAQTDGAKEMLLSATNSVRSNLSLEAQSIGNATVTTEHKRQPAPPIDAVISLNGLEATADTQPKPYVRAPKEMWYGKNGFGVSKKRKQADPTLKDRITHSLLNGGELLVPDAQLLRLYKLLANRYNEGTHTESVSEIPSAPFHPFYSDFDHLPYTLLPVFLQGVIGSLVEYLGDYALNKMLVVSLKPRKLGSDEIGCHAHCQDILLMPAQALLIRELAMRKIEALCADVHMSRDAIAQIYDYQVYSHVNENGKTMIGHLRLNLCPKVQECSQQECRAKQDSDNHVYGDKDCKECQGSGKVIIGRIYAPKQVLPILRDSASTEERQAAQQRAQQHLQSLLSSPFQQVLTSSIRNYPRERPIPLPRPSDWLGPDPTTLKITKPAPLPKLTPTPKKSNSQQRDGKSAGDKTSDKLQWDRLFKFLSEEDQRAFRVNPDKSGPYSIWLDRIDPGKTRSFCQLHKRDHYKVPAEVRVEVNDEVVKVCKHPKDEPVKAKQTLGFVAPTINDNCLEAFDRHELAAICKQETKFDDGAMRYLNRFLAVVIGQDGSPVFVEKTLREPTDKERLMGFDKLLHYVYRSREAFLQAWEGVVVKWNTVKPVLAEDGKAVIDKQTGQPETEVEHHEIDVADSWVKHESRRTVQSIGFFTNPDSQPQNSLNLYHPPDWSAAMNAYASLDLAKKAAEPWFAFMRDSVSSGNANKHDWLMKWITRSIYQAWILQSTAPVLEGIQGCGKTGPLSYLFDHALGRHFAKISGAEQLFDNFNGVVTQDPSVLLIDEFKRLSDRRMGQLNDKITTDKHLVNIKNVPQFFVHKVIHYWAATETPDSLNIPRGSRRWVVFSVGESLGGYKDTEKAKKWKEIYDTPVPAILRVLKDEWLPKLQGWEADTNRPVDADLVEMQIASSPFLRWIRKTTSDSPKDNVAVWTEWCEGETTEYRWGEWVPVDVMWDSFERDEAKQHELTSSLAFAKRMRQQFEIDPKPKETKRTEDKSRRRMIRLCTLKEARNRLAKLVTATEKIVYQNS